MIYLDKISLSEYQEVLKNLHECILDISLEIKRLCKKGNIKFFLIGGSLLGAVRHHGFIPWDDDMDIGILREDYKVFISLCKKELSPRFRLITTETKNYGLPYVKIQLAGTVFQELYAPTYEFGNGIFVDVFPIDRLPDGIISRKIQSFVSSLLKYSLLHKCKYKFTLGKSLSLKSLLANCFSATVSKKFIIKMLDSIHSMFNQKRTKYYMNSGSAYCYGKEIFPEKSLTGILPEIMFEGELFPCPKNKEEILENLYGNYLQLPPLEKRYNRHGVVSIDFGDN